MTAAAAVPSARAVSRAVGQYPTHSRADQSQRDPRGPHQERSALQRGPCVTEGTRVADAAGPTRRQPEPAAYREGAEANAAGNPASLASRSSIAYIGPFARSCRHSPGRNLGVSLERQLDDLKPVPARIAFRAARRSRTGKGSHTSATPFEDHPRLRSYLIRCRSLISAHFRDLSLVTREIVTLISADGRSN